jgi:predicted nucleic-acid-binding protein
MKSLDTNVLARFFIDDPDDAQAAQQRPAAVAAFSEPTMVTITVILEFEWVMRGFYGLARTEITRVLTALMGIEHVTVEDRDAVSAALHLFDTGMDLADALHLVRSYSATAFVTFDRKLANRAKALGSSPAIDLLK